MLGGGEALEMAKLGKWAEDLAAIASKAERFTPEILEGKRNILSLGGEGEVPGAINLNNLEGLFKPISEIQESGPLVRADITRPFPIQSGTIDQVVARRLPGFPDEGLRNIADESFRTLRQGGEIHLQSNSANIENLNQALIRAGFQNVRNGKGIKL